VAAYGRLFYGVDGGIDRSRVRDHRFSISRLIEASNYDRGATMQPTFVDFSEGTDTVVRLRDVNVREK